MKKLALCLLAGLNTALAQIPTNGLIGRWEFSGNANDLSGSGNHGTVTGATLIPDRCGKPNSAYQFNGINNYIQMLNPGPTGNASRSVSFWAKTNYTSFGNGNLAMAAFAYGGDASPIGTSFEIQINYNCQGIGLDVANHELIRSNGCISDGAWHHFVLVHDAHGSQQLDAVDFYVDGVFQSQISCFQSGTTQMLNTGSSLPVTIGCNGNFPNAIRWFQGAVDDYYLYNRPLSAGEVQQLFTSCPVSGSTLTCLGTAQVYTIVPIAGASSYTWSLPGGWSGSSSTSTIQVLPGSSSGTVSVSAMNTCGALVTQKLAVVSSECLGIEQNEMGFQAELIPNPADSRVSIRGDFGQEPVNVKIIDLCGKTIYAATLGKDANSIDLSEVKAGIYSVEIVQGDRRTFKRLVKS